MRTKSEVKEEKQGVINEFNLKEAFVLWKNKSKNGNDYLAGFTPNKESKLVAYFNTNKKNPKQPDITIYAAVDGKQDIEVANLWENVSETKGTRYLTGSTNDKEKLVAFYGKDEKKPYIRAFYKED